MNATDNARALVTEWLDDDEQLRIPDTEWGNRLYCALRDLLAAGRAETTTATVEDAARIIESTAFYTGARTIIDGQKAAQALADAGLLAPTPALPTRKELALAITRGVDGVTASRYERSSTDYRQEILQGADAVLALFGVAAEASNE